MLPFLPFFIQEVGVTDPVELSRWVGLCSSVPAIGMGLMAPVWGALADRFGRKLMMIRSMAAGSCLLFLMSMMGSVEGIFTLRIVQGLFTGTITASATLVASSTPRAKLGYALGFLSSSTFIGHSIGPFLGGLSAEFLGYRAAFRIGGAMLTLGLISVVLFVRDIRLNEPDKKEKPKGQNGNRSYLTLFGLLLGMMFLLRFCRSLPYPFLPLHIQQTLGTVEGASVLTGVLTSLIGVAAATSALLIVRLGDRMNKLRLISTCLAATALASVPLFFMKNLWGFGVVYVVMIFASGAVEPLLQSYFSEHTPAAKRGKLFGIQAMVASIGWFAAPLVGSTISVGLGIPYIFLFTSMFFIFAFAYSLVVKKVSTGTAGRSLPQA